MLNRYTIVAAVAAVAIGSVTPADAQELELMRLQGMLESARMNLNATSMQLEPMLASQMLESRLALELARPSLELAQMSMLSIAPNLDVLRGLQGGYAVAPRAPRDVWFPQDTADAMYRRGRSAFNSREYSEAVRLFRVIREQHSASRYLPQAMFYEAFALSRLGAENDFRTARTILDRYRDRYGAAEGAWTQEHAELYTTIQGRLARMGDADAAAAIAAQAAQLADRNQSRSQIDDDDVRMQALNALLQMDSENAMVILREVLANRDPSRVEMRRRAVFLVAQKRAAGREEILLSAARSDPDTEVREQAVRWLSQVRTDEAVAALDSILQSSEEESLQRQAIFALSQHRSERAIEILQNYVRRSDAPAELRSHAIQWVGQRRGNSEFLREIFRDLDDPALRERTLFALSQRRNQENADFLMAVAMDESEGMDVRKRALFWAGQMRGFNIGVYELYGRTTDREMKEQLIAVYGQRRRDSTAVDQLIFIVRNEEDAELRSKAIFWLGQTRDPRAVEVLREIINR